MPHAGKRSDIQRVREIIKEGGKLPEILEEVNSYQAAKFGELYLMNRPPEEENHLRYIGSGVRQEQEKHVVPWTW